MSRDVVDRAYDNVLRKPQTRKTPASLGIFNHKYMQILIDWFCIKSVKVDFGHL